jgi:hypothetical protein
MTSLSWVKFEENDKRVTLDFNHTHSPVTPLEAGNEAIKFIQANYPPPYNLLVSGGIDSQAMLYLWMKSGVEFNVISYQYNDEFNAHDLVQLKEFSSLHNIKVEYRDLDLLAFLQNEYHDYATRYRCTSPQICTHMKMTEGLEGTSIFSGNFIHSQTAFITDALLGLHRYGVKTNKPIIPFFFLETPEFAYSFQPIHNQYEYDLTNSYAVKVQAYHQAGFPVIAQSEKFTGFEKVKDYYDLHFKDQVTVQQRIEFSNKPSKRTFDLLLRYPYEKLLGERLVRTHTNP